MTPEQRDALRIALVHLILASAKDPTLEKTIKILRNMIMDESDLSRFANCERPDGIG